MTDTAMHDLIDAAVAAATALEMPNFELIAIRSAGLLAHDSVTSGRAHHTVAARLFDVIRVNAPVHAADHARDQLEGLL